MKYSPKDLSGLASSSVHDLVSDVAMYALLSFNGTFHVLFSQPMSHLVDECC